MKRRSILIGSFFWLAASVAGAQETVEERWRAFRRLTRDQQKKMREDYVRFLRLDPADQERVRAWVRSWRGLPEKEKSEVRDGLRRWSRLDASERQILFKTWQTWQGLSPAQQDEWIRKSR